ncbi:MAG: indolepyruvate ferredoxin oxidoreductase subunit beta [Candidatus Thermoplasmatota archaeon]
MKDKTNIVLTGVGGHGVITAANILGKAAVAADVNVFVSEVHGMAQRGGSVNCTIRMGNVSGPLVPHGSADAIVSTEPIEALRYIYFANKKTKIVTDTTPVIPFTVSVGLEEYPNLEEVFEEIKSKSTLYKFDAVEIAKNAGALVTKNVVLLGALAATDLLPFESDILLDTIVQNVPSNYKSMNKKAFHGGFEAFKKI